ncbi:MAG: hypothetical protein Q4G71_02990 [Pseudomonadota bacterium]|nr:hypothetical protein [Pseudomonadota bacterium]
MEKEVLTLTPAGVQTLQTEGEPHTQLHHALVLVHRQPLSRAQLVPLMPRGELTPAQCLDTLARMGLIARKWLRAARAPSLDERHGDALRAFAAEALSTCLPPRLLQHELDLLNRARSLPALRRRILPTQALIAQYAGPDAAREFNQSVRAYLHIQATEPELVPA